jgi:hypothetical protein
LTTDNAAAIEKAKRVSELFAGGKCPSKLKATRSRPVETPPTLQRYARSAILRIIRVRTEDDDP